MRMAGSYALTNKQVESGGVMVTPEKYVVMISGNLITLKARMKDQSDVDVQSYSFDDYGFLVCDNLTVECDDSTAQPKSLPVEISYSLGDAKLAISDTVTEIENSVAVLFLENNASGTLKRYIVVYKVSGLAEEYKYPLK